MRLSIITINYNNLVGLRKTFDSIVTQNWTDYEWIIIDGGSSDGSKEFIEENLGRFSYWCSEPDKGIYNAQNKGILRAVGDYLLFMNSGDSLCCKDTLKSIFSSNISEDVIYGNTLRTNQGKIEIVRYPNPMTLGYLIYGGICHQSTFFKRSVFGDSLYREDVKITADWMKNLDLFLQGKTFKYINETISEYDMTGLSSVNVQVSEAERDVVLLHLIEANGPLILSEIKRIQEELLVYENSECKAAKRLVDRGHIRKFLLSCFLNSIDRIDKVIGVFY